MKIINSAVLNAIRTGFKSLYMASSSAVKPQWPRIAMEVKSTSSSMKYGWLGKLTSMKEWLGDRIIQNLKEHSYTIQNKSYENTVGVDRDAIEDDELGVYAPMIADLGTTSAELPDTLIFGLLKKGFDTVCYDGQYFFDTDHPVTDENGVVQSVSNFGGGAGAGWYLVCSNRPVKPLIFQSRKAPEFVALDSPDDANVFGKKEFLYGVDMRCNVGFGLWQLVYASKDTLNVTNYANARAAIMSMKGENGRPLNLVPDLLVVHPGNEKAGLGITNAEKDAAGADNVYKGTAELMVVPLLA